MKKIVLYSWVIITIASFGFLAFSTLYEIDSYQTVIDFKFEISKVEIIVNATGGFEIIRINAEIQNPSIFSSIRLKSIENTIFLNEQGSEYLHKVHWFTKMIPPGKHSSLSWTYTIIPSNYGIFRDANNSSLWVWNFDIYINLVSPIVNEGQYDRSQGFQGVDIITP